MRALFNAYLFNPVFWHVWDAIQNPRIRKILVRGGSAAGKTFSICDVINLRQLEELKNCLAIRKHRVHVSTTIKKSFETSIDRLKGLEKYYQKMEGEIRVGTGALTFYAGMDDPEKVKGLESFDWVYMTELNQFDPTEWDEVNRRLRGRPGQKILADWNPISKTHWINDEILNEAEGWQDMDLFLPELEEAFGAFTALTPGHAFKKINAAGDTIWINVTYRDNFWIVGHPGNTVPAVPGEIAFLDANPTNPVTLREGMFIAPDGNLYGFEDVHTIANFEKMKVKKPNDYRIYGLGEDGLIRTGGEFFPMFDEEKHVQDFAALGRKKINPEIPIHVTVDNNVEPYVTIGLWQVQGNEIAQPWEIPAEEPNNTASKAAILLDKFIRLQAPTYNLALYIYGDPSSRSRTTVDDNGRSFFDKFISTLELLGWRIENRVIRKAPPVAISGDFINDIYDEQIKKWRIVINLACRKSIEDYALVKKNPLDGSMLKEKVPDPKDPDKKRKIEKYGHFSDAKRYFFVKALEADFIDYQKRRRQPRVQAVNEYET